MYHVHLVGPTLGSRPRVVYTSALISAVTACYVFCSQKLPDGGLEPAFDGSWCKSIVSKSHFRVPMLSPLIRFVRGSVESFDQPGYFVTTFCN
jgi:hypothetical protein